MLSSVSSTNLERWAHSRQPRYGQIPYFSSKEAAAALAKAYDKEYSMPQLAVAAGFEPDF